MVYAGLGTRDHVRAGLQLLSGDVPRRTVYAHTGWRRVDDLWLYLHAGGAIGRLGRVTGIEVCLADPLLRFDLPDPPAGEELRTAIRASLRQLELAPQRITYPLYASVSRAVLCAADFSVFVVGPTNEGKTELVARAQQHWGSEMDSRRLPANWSSTGNALEGLTFAAKDVLLTVDDFAPGGGQVDIQKLHREADRILRAQGNRSGRQRMRADLTLRPERYPRGLIACTGEDVPRGQSLRGRTLILEVGPGDIDWSKMTAAQADGAKGLYAQALAGFVRWLAPIYEKTQEEFRRRVTELREQATQSGLHRRTPFIVANLMAGLELWLRYATEVEALKANEAARLWEEGWAALGEAAAAQMQHQAAAEPTRRFLELISAALASGRAHVVNPHGVQPNREPEAWGWRPATVGTGNYAGDGWRPQGECVGWLDNTNLYLEPDAAYSVIQVLGRDGGEVLGVSLPTSSAVSTKGVFWPAPTKRAGCSLSAACWEAAAGKCCI